MDLTDMLRGIGRGWVWVLLGLIVGGALAWTYLRVTPPEYSATAQVVLLANGPATISEAEQGVALSAQLVDTVATIIDSPAVLEDVAADQFTVGQTLEMVEAAPIPLTSTIEVTVTAESPEVAAEIANATVANASDVVPEMLGDSNLQGERPVTLRSISPATVPDEPSSPHTQGVWVIGLSLGLLTGIAIALILESSRMRGAPSAKAPRGAHRSRRDRRTDVPAD